MRIKSILLLLVIALSAFFWTFINYQNRWTLSQDQARDAIIGLYSIQHRSLPLVGPPSSLGFFSFGPFYYWLIVLFMALAPSVINAPWIGFSLFSIFEVILFYFIGKSLGGKKFGFVLGIVASFSSARVFHSVDLLNPILVPFFTTLAMYSMIKLLDTKKVFWAFLLSFSIAISINFHFQALGLLSILVLIFIPFFKTEVSIKSLGWILLGLFIPFLPLIFFYWQTLLPLHISQSSSFFSLFSIPKQFVKDSLFTWPNLFGETLFFTPSLGYPIVLGVLGFFLWLYKQKIHLPKAIQIILSSLLIQIVFLPFYSGERTPVYLLVFHPYIILLTSYIGWVLYQKWKSLGFILFGLFLLLSTWSNISIIKGYTQRPFISQIKRTIDNQTRGKNQDKIDLYEAGNSDLISLPLFYLYLRENRISDNGFKLGSCEYNCPSDGVPFLVKGTYSFYNLQDANPLQIADLSFKKVTLQRIYNYLSNYYTH